MGTEIERKFLVEGDWRQAAPQDGIPLAQGYLRAGPGTTVRVRLAGDRAWLTIKGPETLPGTRLEYEYPIPVDEAREMIAPSEGHLVVKTRYRIPHGGHLWEVDEFGDSNQGLVLAEVELRSSSEPVDLPPWVGREVTGDPCYGNAELSRRPVSSWGWANL